MIESAIQLVKSVDEDGALFSSCGLVVVFLGVRVRSPTDPRSLSVDLVPVFERAGEMIRKNSTRFTLKRTAIGCSLRPIAVARRVKAHPQLHEIMAIVALFESGTETTGVGSSLHHTLFLD